MSMPDLMNAFNSLQSELDHGMLGIQTEPCEMDKRYILIVDEPNGRTRFSYAKIIDGELLALSIFAQAEPIDGIPCFNLGYAVKPGHRGKGFALEAASVGVKELVNGLGRAHKVASIYVEAVVDVSNQPSIKVAERFFSQSGKQVTDKPSGKPAFHYEKLFQL